MDVGEFFEDLGTIAKDIAQGTVSVASDVLNGAASAVGGMTNGVATVASKTIETVGTCAGGAVSVVNQAAGSRIASGCRLAANGVQAAGTGVSGGLKMGVGIVTGVSNIIVGNEEKADEIGLAASDALETSKETLGECSDKIVHELPGLFMPPTRGIAATFLKEPVKPIPGSVVCCKLALLVDHSGIYIGGGRIIHRDGDYGLTCVDIETFLRRLNGNNPAITVYVSSKMDSLTKGHAVGSQSVADRAVKALNDPAHSNGYNLLTKNCHQFCQYCLTGRIDNGMVDCAFSNLESVLRRSCEFDCWHVLDGCWKTSANDVFTENAYRNCSRASCGRRLMAQKGFEEDDSGLNRGSTSRFPNDVKVEKAVGDDCESKPVMVVLVRAGRNEYEVKEWLMRNMYVGFPLATQLVQKRSVLKTSMPYDQAMQWKRELEALGAAVEVS